MIGIGAGDPDYVTVQAIKALNRVDVFFVVDKGNEKHDLVDLRKELCDLYIENQAYRWVEVRDPERDRNAAAYSGAVDDWRRARAGLFEAAIREELGVDECGGFLVWGDPALYDSTLAVIDDLKNARSALELDVEVIPGISSVQALAAKHRVALNRVGTPIHITTGRLLAQGLPDGADDVVVMLDADCSFKTLALDVASEFDIYWGAYIGTKDELLISGSLEAVGDEISQVRSDARAQKGWIMDTYLLRRRRK